MRILLACVVCACTPPLPEPDPLVEPAEPLREWLNTADGSFFTQTTVALDATSRPTTLRAFANTPGATLFAVAEAADLAALATLRAALAPAIAAQLEGWYADALAGNALGRIGVLGLAEGVGRLPARVLIESELVLTLGAVYHRLDTIYLSPDTLEDAFAVGEVEGEQIELDIVTSAVPTSHGGRLELAAHQLAIELGDYAWRHADGNLASSGGIRGALGGLTLCPLVASTVANTCGGACAGHLGQLAELCERGLDELVTVTRAEVATTLRFVGGSVALIDHDADEVADALTGTWDAELDPADGATSVSAGFTARRPLTP